MDRRSVLRRGAALTSGISLSGCLSQLGFETQSAWRDPPLVENRPDAVYYPAIIEGMGMYGVAQTNGIGFALMHSFPHRFWNLTGERQTKVVVQSSDSVHLMASVWDVQTKTVLPIDVSADISNDGKQVISTNLWPMISPNMGFHYGDNIALPGEGKYDITLSTGPLQADRTKPFEGQFTGSNSVSMEFEFNTNETYNLELRRLGDKAGTRGTVELMNMKEVPKPTAPPKDKLPGRLVAAESSGDATFLIVVTEGNSRFTPGSGAGFIVSPRTPYNRVLLPRMALSATVMRDGNIVSQGNLQTMLDPQLSLYYAANIEDLNPGDTVTIEIDSPPQLARHDGYETAFLDMQPIRFTL